MQHRNGNEDSMQELLRFAHSPEGKKLIRSLQQKGGEELQQAVAKASSGDYSQAQQAITALLDTPEAKRLLEQLGR